MGWVGCRRTATRVIAGHRVLEQLHCFPMNAALGPETPVIFPPGRARLLTNPAPIGSVRVTHDDGNRRRRLLGGSGCGSPCRDEDLDREAHQLGRQRGEPLVLPLGIAELQDEILPLHIAEVAQRLPEDLEIGIGAAASRP